MCDLIMVTEVNLHLSTSRRGPIAAYRGAGVFKLEAYCRNALRFHEGTRLSLLQLYGQLFCAKACEKKRFSEILRYPSKSLTSRCYITSHYGSLH